MDSWVSLLPWWKRFRYWLFGMPEFKPCVVYNEALFLTQVLLEDVSMVWCPLPGRHDSGVDLAYSNDGRLVGVQIWDDVRTRPVR